MSNTFAWACMHGEGTKKRATEFRRWPRLRRKRSALARPAVVEFNLQQSISLRQYERIVCIRMVRQVILWLAKLACGIQRTVPVLTAALARPSEKRGSTQLGAGSWLGRSHYPPKSP